MFGQPEIIKAVVLASRDLIEDFAVEPVGGLPPLRRVAEVVPNAKAYFSAVITHDLPPAYLQAPWDNWKAGIRDKLLREPSWNGDPGVQTTRKPR
jgi:hypothetical protein